MRSANRSAGAATGVVAGAAAPVVRLVGLDQRLRSDDAPIVTTTPSRSAEMPAGRAHVGTRSRGPLGFGVAPTIGTSGVLTAPARSCMQRLTADSSNSRVMPGAGGLISNRWILRSDRSEM